MLPAALAICAVVASSTVEAAEANSRAGRALLDAASMEPVEVALASNKLWLTSEETGRPVPPAPADHRIVFRLPAAYLAQFALDRDVGGAAAGSIVVRLWSRSLDPVRPDEMADFARCPAWQPPGSCTALGPDGGRIAARLRAGEYPLKVTVTNQTGTAAHRRYTLRAQAGLARNVGSGDLDPCDVREDPALGMLVGRAPEGVRPFMACRFRSNGAVYRDGRHFAPASFLKLGPDGEPKFAALCPVYIAAGDAAEPEGCEFVGYFGVWPLFLPMRSDRAPEWDGDFERVRAFLARHVVSRTD